MSEYLLPPCTGIALAETRRNVDKVTVNKVDNVENNEIQ